MDADTEVETQLYCEATIRVTIDLGWTEQDVAETLDLRQRSVRTHSRRLSERRF